jgi:signal-transduction protein with cAMP-binding, CBS, and nucleotidyltransferase domain
MASVANILGAKGRTVHTVRPHETVYEAVRSLRRIVLEGRTSRTTAVAELMIPDALCVSPDASVDQCMRLMTDKRVRHLPVVDDDELVGLVSIGDVVKTQISQHRSIVDQMAQYIQGRA